MTLETARRWNTITCIYVLNVLPPVEQVAVVDAVLALLEPGGRAYFAVRRDVRRGGQKGRGVWQRRVMVAKAPLFGTNDWLLYRVGEGALNPVVVPGATSGEAFAAHIGADHDRSRVAMGRAKVSAPMRVLKRKGLLVGEVLDYGCGHGRDAQDLGLWSWDPHHRPTLTPPVGA